MADEPIQDDHPELPPRSAPMPEREPIVIDGEATDVTPPEVDAEPSEPSADEFAAEAQAETEHPAEPESIVQFEAAPPAPGEEPPAAPEPERQPEPESRAERTPPPTLTPRRSRLASFGGFVALFLGLVVIIGAALFVGAYVRNPFNDAMKASDEQAHALDAALKDEVAARTALEARVAAAEAKANQNPAAPKLDALEARIAKLEGSVVTAPALAAVEAEAKAALAAAHKAAQPSPAAPATTPEPEATASKPVSPLPIDSALADRVAKLEAALATPAPSPEVAQLAIGQTALADRVAKLEAPAAPNPEIAQLASGQTALADRVTKLEAPVAPNPEVAQLASGANALADRIAKLEAALSAQKSEARAEPLAVAKRIDPVAEAVAAISLAQRLAEGEPYAAEFAALAKAGADAGALAALKPYADTGAPTPGKLAVAFAKIAPTLTGAARPEAKGEVVDQMMDKLRALVKVRVVGEIQGEDPAALVSRIAGALARGDVAAALTTEAKLPDAARATAAAWEKDAEGMESATSAARSLAEMALERFANAKN